MNVTEEMQLQAKALSDPSRFKLFRFVVDASRPVSVAELTEFLGFNHNAIRQHLAVLIEAGIFVESTEQRPMRGRPRKQYHLRSDALDAFASVSGAYGMLAGLLVEVASSTESPYDIGFRSAGSYVVGRPAGDRKLVDELFHQLSVHGFEPLVSSRGVVTLERCPFADVAVKSPDIVCELHRGLLDGFLSLMEPESVVELLPRNAHKAGCKVKLSTGSS